MKIWKFYETHRWIQRDFIVDEHDMHFPLVRFLKIRNEIAEDPTAYPLYGFCISGAMGICYPDFTQRIAISRKLWETLDESPIEWNDRKTRTKEDVVALCKALDI